MKVLERLRSRYLLRLDEEIAELAPEIVRDKQKRAELMARLRAIEQSLPRSYEVRDK